MPNTNLELPSGYGDWLATVKKRIATAQQRASLAVNQELVLLYWQIGQQILDRQQHQGWGAKVIDQLPGFSLVLSCNERFFPS